MLYPLTMIFQFESATQHKLFIFESDRDDPHPSTCFSDCNYNLYLMDADGENVCWLTDLPGARFLGELHTGASDDA
jgi:hypothetical protein